MFNQITLIGNLTRDIELRYSQSGMGIAKTAIATSHKFTSNGEKKEETCFIDITAFGKSGETMNQYLRKGSKVLIVGRLQLEQWADQNGQKRSKHSVIIETMKMLDSKSESNNGETNQAPQQGQQQTYSQNQSGSNQTNHTSYQQPQQQQSYQQPQQNGYQQKELPTQQYTND